MQKKTEVRDIRVTRWLIKLKILLPGGRPSAEFGEDTSIRFSFLDRKLDIKVTEGFFQPVQHGSLLRWLKPPRHEWHLLNSHRRAIDPPTRVTSSGKHREYVPVGSTAASLPPTFPPEATRIGLSRRHSPPSPFYRVRPLFFLFSHHIEIVLKIMVKLVDRDIIESGKG